MRLFNHFSRATSFTKKVTNSSWNRKGQMSRRSVANAATRECIMTKCHTTNIHVMTGITAPRQTVEFMTWKYSAHHNIWMILITSSGWLFNSPTNWSMAFSSWNLTTFSGLMAHFQMAPVAAANKSLFSLLPSNATRGSRPPYWRTRSRVSFSSAHWKHFNVAREWLLEKYFHKFNTPLDKWWTVRTIAVST